MSMNHFQKNVYRMHLYALYFYLALFAVAADAEEGMWTMDHLPLQAMQRDLNWAPQATWIDHAMHGAARIANGCSASFVSKDGLVLTNHHCVAECVEEISNEKENHMIDGFLAKERTAEKKCPAMEVNRLEKITDVTVTVQKATQGLSGTAFKLAQNAIKAKLSEQCVGDQKAKARCEVVTLYQGGQYQLYRYHRFQDVRLVFAPEQAAAFFGGDPDNFMFPRYDFDMSLIRVYEDDQPARVKEYFPLNAKGPSENEPVFTIGNPGATQRQLTVAQLQSLRDNFATNVIPGLAQYRGLLTEFGNRSPESKRISTAELFYVENSYKALHGELEALLEPSVFNQKTAEEKELKEFVNSKVGLKEEIGDAWQTIEQAEIQANTLRIPFQEIEKNKAFRTVYYSFAKMIVRGVVEKSKNNADRLPEFNESELPQIEAALFSEAPIYPEFEIFKLNHSLIKMRELLGVDHALVKKILGKQSPDDLAKQWVGGTQLADIQERKKWWNSDIQTLKKSTDPFIQLALEVDPQARELRTRYENDVESPINKASEKIAKARFAMYGADASPDATFSMRLSYGRVKGWTHNNEEVPAFTDFKGAYERATGADPFRLPDTWLKAKNQLDLKMPLNFSSTNDIIGGNSGSPVLNQKGELVGLIFDGNIHSLGGAFWFDPKLNRAVSVDSAAIVQGMDKIYGARKIADELVGR